MKNHKFKGKNNNNSEIDTSFYNEILRIYNTKKKDLTKSEILRYQSIIKLMNLMKQKGDKELVKNVIIIIQALFENNPPDLYHSHGKTTKSIDSEEKSKFLYILKNELTLSQ